MSKLTYKECLIDVGVLGTHAEAFQELHAKISGRAGEFGTIAKPVSTHFGGLVGESLKGVATENHEAWSSSMMACIHAYGIIQKVISDVEWYEEEIESIKADLASALGALPSTGDELEDASIRNAAVIHYNELADETWRKLEKRCETTEERLGEGPTPENIKELIAAGHIGDGVAYATTGDIDYFYFEESDAITMANFFKTAVEGYGGSIDALDGQLALLNALVLKALQAQQNGDKLSDNEIDFLEALFAELEIEENRVEQLGGETTPQDFLYFIDLLNESEYIDSQIKEDINRNLANSMLLLSDENIGGGIDRLPEDVKKTVTGPTFGESFYPEMLEWHDNYILLSDLLGSSGPGVMGGVEFSVELAASSARMLDYADRGDMEEKHFNTVIDVVSRNDKANYVLLTGENPDGSPYELHQDNQSMVPKIFLEEMYSYEWKDKGESVGKFTDWIISSREFGSSDEVDMAGEAAHSLITILTEVGGEENEFFNTGKKVDGNVDASVAELNPSLADSLANIYISFIDDFTLDHHQDGYQEIFDHKSGSLPFHIPGDKVLLLPVEVREKFMQLLVANEDISPKVLAATESQEWSITKETFKNPDLGAQSGGATAANLREMMTNAIIQEHLDRTGDIEEAREAAKKKWEAGYGVFSTLVGDKISGGAVTSIATDIIDDILKTEYMEFAESKIKNKIPDAYYLEDEEGTRTEAGDFILYDPQSEVNHATLQIANVFFEMGLIDPDNLKEEHLLITDPQGNERLPITTQEWDGVNAKVDALRNIISEASIEGTSLGDDVSKYITEYEWAYDPNLYKTNLE